MPRFIIERNTGALTREQLDGAGKVSNGVLAEMPDVVWVRSFVANDEGKVYCEYNAPNREAVMEHARRAGLPADRISEVSMEINPTMFS